jgi:hypothetical protein
MGFLYRWAPDDFFWPLKILRNAIIVPLETS